MEDRSRYNRGNGNIMRITLWPPWELNTDHPATSSGEPVLVNHKTGTAFHSKDLMEAFPAWGRMSAAQTVKRMVRGKKYRDDEIKLIKRFTKHY
jgi:hypothetical protein